ncbi:MULTISPECIES: plasmid pRiA4b ORF-3 family protein [Burkholderia]|nr:MULTISPECIES: plasmid pRiA4b ORF-3 family protein [Burkholderia]
MPGYADFLEAITDPTHEEQDQFLEWCGRSFDLAAFDLVLANQRLSEVKF